MMSPGTLEAHGLASNKDLDPHSNDPHRKFAGNESVYFISF